MRFTKKDIIKLVENYGRAFYNPGLSGKSKQNFLKIIRTESFPGSTIEELSDKFEWLYKKYQAGKLGHEKKFEYFQVIDKAVKLAHLDYMPKSDDIEVLSDDSEDEDYVSEELPVVTNEPKINCNKRKNDEEINGNAKKTARVESEPSTQVNSIDPQKDETLDESILKVVEKSVTNAVMGSLNKKDDKSSQLLNDSIQSMKSELRSIIQNGTVEIVQTLMKKEKEQRLSEIYVMMKTLLDEQREANEAIKEVATILKSTIAGQKIQHDMDIKRREIEKSNEILLKQMFSIMRQNNTK